MSNGVVIVLMVAGVATELHSMWLVRKFGSQLTFPLRVTLTAKKFSVLLILLSAGFSLVATKFERPLETIFVVSVVAWLVSTICVQVVLWVVPRTKAGKNQSDTVTH